MGPLGPARFVVLTWNVWFGEFQFDLRARSLLAQTLELSPDIICFQEVTERFMQILAEIPTYQSLYILSSRRTEHVYGTIMLVKSALRPEYRAVELPTGMGRVLLFARLHIFNRSIAVANVHLESLDHHRVRELQLEAIEQVLLAFDTAIVVGDFNFCSCKNFKQSEDRPLENDSLRRYLPSYIDLWPHLSGRIGPHSPAGTPSAVCPPDGYTYDSEANGMLSHKHERGRYDRVLLKSADVDPLGIRRVGLEPVAEGVWPSDHFGLLSTFRYGLSSQTSRINANADSQSYQTELIAFVILATALMAIKLCFSEWPYRKQRYLLK